MIKRWVSLFFIGNMVAFWLLGLLYLPSIAWVNTGLLKGAPLWIVELNLYTLVSYLGLLGILSFVPLILVWPAVYLFRSERFIIFLSVLLACLSLCLLVTDIVIYHLYRFHLNGVIFQFFLHSFNKEFFDLSVRECAFAFVILSSILVLESLYAFSVWHFVIKKGKYIKLGKEIAVLLVFCISISYATVLFSLHSDFNRIFVETSRFLPFYEEGLNRLLPKYLAVAIMREGQYHEEHGRRDLSQLHYPTKDLQFGAQKKLPNLLVILIDAWRYDMLNPIVTPSLYQFSKQSWTFSHHFSGGNATGPGVFSIFYGIPATYWTVMETQGRGPLLVDELINRHYQMRIFSSPSMLMPAFDKTVFVRLKDQLNESCRFIKEMQGNPYQRDVIAVNQFFEFLKEREKTQPFFSYIHLDSAHAYCALNNVSLPFKPVVKMCNRAELMNDSDPVPYFNRYKNALKLDDQLFQKIVNKLQNENLLANTIVIVTGDHGEEFNDGHHDYWSHASNYTKYQTQTPLIVYWPGEKPKAFQHLTSHYDLVPTLLKRMFGCTNLAQDYSVGKDLLDSSRRPYLLIDGYIDFGVVENDRITRILSTGDFQILDTQGLVMPGATLRMPVMNNVFSEIRQFYQ